MKYDKKVCRVATKMLHAYENLMENCSKENVSKWGNYGWESACIMCQSFRCEDCPLLFKWDDHCSSGGDAANTMVALMCALGDVNLRKSKKFKRIERAARRRYEWLLAQLDKNGFEYK